MPPIIPTVTQVDAENLRARALRLLAAREHSRAELARKLAARGARQDAIASLLDQLEHDGLLHEARLVETYVAERLAKGFGPLRVRAELQAKGIADHLIDPHLDLTDDTCLELLRAAARRHFGDDGRRPDANDDADHDGGGIHQEEDQDGDRAARRLASAKQARFLESRGFPAHLIARYLASEPDGLFMDLLME